MTVWARIVHEMSNNFYFKQTKTNKKKKIIRIKQIKRVNSHYSVYTINDEIEAVELTVQLCRSKGRTTRIYNILRSKYTRLHKKVYLHFFFTWFSQVKSTQIHCKTKKEGGIAMTIHTNKQQQKKNEKQRWK